MKTGNLRGTDGTGLERAPELQERSHDEIIAMLGWLGEDSDLKMVPFSADTA